MRLLVISQYFWPENFRINDLVAELLRRGHEITVLTGWPNYPEGVIPTAFRRNPSAFSSFEGARIVRVPLLPRGTGGLRLLLNYASFAISASVLGIWKLRGKKFDAIFVYEPSPITVGIPAAAIRYVKQSPVAFWVLDLWPETLKAVGAVRSNIILKLVGKLVRFIYSHCDLILAQSHAFIASIRNYSGHNTRIEYFPSWSEHVPDLREVEAAPEISIEPDAFNVMFAGNIGEAQDFPAILQAADLLRNQTHIRWLIVGDGRMAAWVQAEIERRGLEGTVSMLGRYPVERMASFYKHAHALLVSLKNEEVFSMTIPAKLQSYLAAGLPIIAMINGEGAEVVTRTKAGLACSAGDAQGLASIVHRMSSMPIEERDEMGRNGKATAEREFDRQKLIGQLEDWMSGMRASGTAAIAQEKSE